LYSDVLLAGFGLGALNEAEDDDIDVYDGMRSTGHKRMAYDVGEAEDDEHVVLGGSRAIHKASGKTVGIVVHSLCHVMYVQLLFQTPSSSTFLHGLPIISGFVRSEKPLIEDRWYANAVFRPMPL
jgi:G patch domain-containing protein 1